MDPSATVLSAPAENAVLNTVAWLPIKTPPLDVLAIVRPPAKTGVGVC